MLSKSIQNINALITQLTEEQQKSNTLKEKKNLTARIEQLQILKSKH